MRCHRLIIPAADEFCVLDADASQTYAINAVLGGQNLIIKGPPGTGKSQTIANLIASLVARGKKVLFVAEKRAAIDAVVKRLDQHHLGDLVLDLHGSRCRVAPSRSYREGAVGGEDHAASQRGWRGSASRRAARRAADYAAAYIERSEPWGLTVYEHAGAARGLKSAPECRTRFRGSTLERLTLDRFEETRERLVEWVDLEGPRMWRGASPWAGAKVATQDQAREAFEVTEDLLRDGLPRLRRLLVESSAETGAATDGRLASVSGPPGPLPRDRSDADGLRPGDLHRGSACAGRGAPPRSPWLADPHLGRNNLRELPRGARRVQTHQQGPDRRTAADLLAAVQRAESQRRKWSQLTARPPSITSLRKDLEAAFRAAVDFLERLAARLGRPSRVG